MSVANGDVCSNWVASIEGRKDFRTRPSHLRGSTVSAVGDQILSYHHWEMGRVIRTRTGEPSFWLLNGDRYSITTSGHQAQVRNAVAKSNLPSIIVPYSALATAGIEHDSILPIEIRADRFIEHGHSIPADFAMPTLRPQEDTGQSRYEKGELSVHGVKFKVTHWSRRYDSELHTYVNCDETSYYINDLSARLVNEQWQWETSTHFLGDSLFSGRVVEHRERPATPEEIEALDYSDRWRQADREAGYPARDTLANAALVERLGPEPLDSPVAYKRRDGEYAVRERIARRVRFLSSFDYNERTPLYFLCELPRRKVETVEEAYELLKPRLVQMAEAGGIEVERQGDIFAVPTELTTKEVKRLTPRGKGRIVKRPAVLGTNHEPSDVMFATGDRVYARGCLYHAPGQGRAPDHARRKMGDGKTWHLLMRNTVPRTVDPDARRSVRV